MSNKRKYLKNILATVSLASVIVGSAGSASAAGYLVTGNTRMNDGTGAGRDAFQNDGTVAGGAPVVAGTVLRFDGAAPHTVDGDVVGAFRIHTGAAPAASNPGIWTVNGVDQTFNGVTGGKRLNVRVATGNSLTLDGANLGAAAVADANAAAGLGLNFTVGYNEYIGLGNVRLEHDNAKVVINPNAADANGIVLTGLIQGNVNGRGKIETGAGKVQFDGEIGGGNNGIRSLKMADNSQVILNANAKFSGDVGAGGIELGDNAVLTVIAGKNINSVAGANGANIFATNANNGTLTFQGDSNLNININGNALSTINIGNGNVTTGANVANIKSNHIKFEGANSKLTLSRDTEIIAKDGITTTSGAGTIYVDAATTQTIKTTAVGGAGDVNNQLENIHFAGDGTVILQHNGLGVPIPANAVLGVKSITTENNGNGTLTLGFATNLGIIHDIGANGAKLKLVNLHSNAGAGAGPATFTLLEGKKIYAMDVDLAAANVDNTLVLKKDTLVDGNVIATNADKGIIRVDGDSRITGNIGNAANSINKIDFNGAHTLTVGGTSIKTNAGTNFKGYDGILHLTEANNNVNVTSAITTIGRGIGSVITDVATDKVAKFNGAVGVDADHKLKLIAAKKGGNLEFNDVVNAAEIDMRKDTGVNVIDQTLTLNHAGDHYFVLKHDNNSVTIKIVADVNFVEGTRFSENAENPFKKMLVDNDKGVRAVTFNGPIAIYADSIEQSKATAHASGFTFNRGTNIIGAQLGSEANKFNSITVANAGTSLELRKDAYLAEDIALDDSTTLKFGGKKLMLRDITGGNTNRTFVFNNQEAAHVTLRNVANALDVVRIEGGDVTVISPAAGPAEAVTKRIEFTNKEKEARLTLPNLVRLGAVEAESAGNRIHTIVASGNQGNVTGKIGRKDNIINIELAGDNGEARLTSDQFFASFTSDKKDKAKFTLAKEGLNIYGIGDIDNRYKEVVFEENGGVVGGLYAKDIKVEADKTATLDQVFGETLLLDGPNGANAVFNDKALVISHIKTTTKDKSTVIFKGEATISNIGEKDKLVEKIELKGTKKQLLLDGDAAYAQKVTFGNDNIVKLNKDYIIGGGAISGKNSTIDLSAHKLTLNSDTTLTGNVTINTTVQDSKDGSVQIGRIVLEDKKLDLTGLTAASTIHVNVDSKRNYSKDSQEFNLVEVSGEQGKIVKSSDPSIFKNISATSKQRFVTWTAVASEDSIKLRSIDSAKEEIKQMLSDKIIDNVEAENLGVLKDAKPGSMANKLFTEISNLTEANGISDEKMKESQKRTLNPIQNVSTVTSELATTINSVVTARISAVSGAAPVAIKQVAGDVTGVAAGDEAAKFGAWGTPFYSQSSQKIRKEVSGFKSKSTGGTFGFDTLVNDSLTLGAAVTVAKTDVKHKDTKAGDKTKVGTFMFSLYAMHNIADNWFAQGIISFGKNKVKNTEKHITPSATETASGKYDSKSYGMEVLGGYNHKLSDAAVLTPMFGIGYTKFSDDAYTQTGTTNRNFAISKKSSHKCEGILGAKVSFATDMDGVSVLPEVHGFVRHSISNKAPKVTMSLDGLPKALTPQKEKPAKTFFNLGTSVMAKSGMFEYGAGYDVYFADKYTGHQGTLKLRVNF
jgi:outer membrane autotransporter protein